MKAFTTKRTVIFLILFLFSLALFAGASYILINGDAKINPGSSVILYPWESTSVIKILPFDYAIPAIPGNNMSLRACTGQYESATFVMNAQDDLEGIEIVAGDLQDDLGNKIPSDEINVRLVKVWYQAGEDIWYRSPGSVLTPELLLKDDSLVNVDYLNRTNYLKITQNDDSRYVKISDPKGRLPSNVGIYDSSVLQPFTMKNNENKQVWMTVHIPDGTPEGDYIGSITISTPHYSPVTMKLHVTVLPFALEPAPVEYGIYYMGIVQPHSTGNIDSFAKTPEQYAIELQDMKDHGVAYPTMYSWDNASLGEGAGTALLLRKQSGLPQDHIYLFGISTGNPDDSAGLKRLVNTVIQNKKITSQYGFGEMYIYGVDEARDDVLKSERPAWNTVHQNGAKVFVAVSDHLQAVDIVGDILDVGVVGGPLDATQAARWHSYGKKIFSYANPQAGVENPGIYRKNYGFALWSAGYDGAMDFAYQANYGNIWNDFDGENYRDHVFAYPTSNGLIDTVEWEGWREGVDDTRYVATLLKNGGNDTEVRTMISDSLKKGEDPAQIREKIIDRILLSYPVGHTK